MNFKSGMNVYWILHVKMAESVQIYAMVTGVSASKATGGLIVQVCIYTL